MASGIKPCTRWRRERLRTRHVHDTGMSTKSLELERCKLNGCLQSVLDGVYIWSLTLRLRRLPASFAAQHLYRLPALELVRLQRPTREACSLF